MQQTLHLCGWKCGSYGPTLRVGLGQAVVALRLYSICGEADILQLSLHEVVLEHQLPLLPLGVGQVLLQERLSEHDQQPMLTLLMYP